MANHGSSVMPVPGSVERPRPGKLSSTVILAALVLAGAWLRVDNLGLRAFSVDEVLHVFAARSLLETGEPILPSGDRYDRALPFTRLVAAAMGTWGESEAVARIPSAVAGVLTIPAVYLLGSLLFGRVVGLLAAFLLCFSPDAVAMSRFTRMYTTVQLLGVLAATGLYVGLNGWRRGLWGRATVRAVSIVSALGCLALAARLHSVAYLLLAPIGAYVAVMAGILRVKDGPGALFRSVYGWALLAGIEVGLLMVVAAPQWFLARWTEATSALSWVGEDEWTLKAYHYLLTDTYGYLWFLAPGATAAALVTAFRPALVVGLLFWLPLVILSGLVATQTPRYLFAFLPYLFLLIATGAQELVQLLWQCLLARLEGAFRSTRHIRALAVGIFASAFVLVPASPWLTAAVKDRGRTFGEFPGVTYDLWREASAYIGGSRAPNDAIIANVDHLALYYVGRVDGRLLTRNERPDPYEKGKGAERTARGWRFISGRSGAPAFSAVQDLAAAVARADRGWLVLERWRLGRIPSTFAPGVEAFIEACLERRSTPADMSLAVFSWRRNGEGLTPRCRAWLLRNTRLAAARARRRPERSRARRLRLESRAAAHRPTTQSRFYDREYKRVTRRISHAVSSLTGP